MKRYLVILFVFLSITEVDAQEYFFNYVGGWANNYSIEMEDGYLLMGLNTPEFFGYHEIYINRATSDGEILDTIVYQWNMAETTGYQVQTSSQSIVQIDENNYVATVTIGYDLSASYFEAGLLNYNINTQEFSVINETTNNLFTVYHSIAHPNDSTLLVGSRIFEEGALEQNVLYNMDMFGNERWHRDFYEGCIYCHMEPRQILPLSNGNIAYMYDFWTEENLPAYHERSKAVIRIVDGETGEEIGEPIYPGDEENYRIWAGGMVELDNGELMVSYTQPYYYDTDGEWQPNWDNTCYIEKYDIETETLLFSSDFYDPIHNGSEADIPGFAYRISQMQKLEDGNILLSGDSGVRGILIKMDTNGGLLWYRTYSFNTYDENPEIQYFKIYHVLPTSDGGFMCTGEYVSYPGDLYPQGIQTAFALKVDQYGCLEEGCQVGIFEQSIEPIKLNVYPNPSTGIFHIELPKENEIYNLTVYNMVGERIRQESALRGNEYLLDMSGMASGIYLLQLMGADGLVYVERIGVEY